VCFYWKINSSSELICLYLFYASRECFFSADLSVYEAEDDDDAMREHTNKNS
jgi:hypothetical protein